MSEEIYDLDTKSESPTVPYEFKYRLGDIVSDGGLMYWGQVSRENKTKKATAMFVCPLCGELFRAYMHNVDSGSTKSCCGTRK